MVDQATADERETSRLIEEVVGKHRDDLVAMRRDLHAHPELSWHEARASRLVTVRLVEAGWRIHDLPGTGVVADLGSVGPVVALRADLDALPVPEATGLPYASTVDGVSHCCGHDIHTTALLGACLALTELHERGLLPGRVRAFFQPAEEVMPGGALQLIEAGVLRDVVGVFGLHCDPALDVGEVGLREGPLTGAADALNILVTGRGGHTSRPHLTEDLTFAMGKLMTELPAALSRRLDPRAGASLVWGMVESGNAFNVIPATGRLAGTVRMLDAIAWSEAEDIVRELADDVVRPYGVHLDITYTRGVPPVVNEQRSTALLGDSVRRVLGAQGLVPTPQSLGGEDFGWYLNQVPGAMGRLGTRKPGGETYDLHQGDLVVDEETIQIGARLLAEVAVAASR